MALMNRCLDLTSAVFWVGEIRRKEDFKKFLLHSTLQKCYFPFLNFSFNQRRLRSFQLGMCRVSWNSVFAKVFLFVGGNKCLLEKLQSKTQV